MKHLSRCGCTLPKYTNEGYGDNENPIICHNNCGGHLKDAIFKI